MKLLKKLLKKEVKINQLKDEMLDLRRMNLTIANDLENKYLQLRRESMDYYNLSQKKIYELEVKLKEKE